MKRRRQTGPLQTAANVQMGPPRTAAANRSGASPRSRAAEKEMDSPAETDTNRNDGPTGTTQKRLQTQEPNKANSNGGSRVGGGACEDQAPRRQC
ncbi:hypothetical protein NDU88_006954 [Pleurodeles waltl]|uniref:Uncharacterized protein n=1 Tax=Pleurodeles waltl TaxID=8319 RepID=A0AAV7UNI0_PLEWA|nr:hypothetical protein NDU88_006954 [Pleurodeles waltl]